MAKKTFLDFEQPIAELESKIEELRYVQNESAVDISEEIDQLSKKSQQLTKDIYADLSPWQVTKIARHPERPYTLDYVRDLFTDFVELHGDRHFADDKSIVGGLARFNGHACMVLGQQKGRDTKERALRNFGMTRPEGYRKALRLMKTAEKFHLPVFTFVDTPGAFPGIDAEERGQSEAIGRNIYEMAQLEVPIITTIIGEGGSGGALALSVCDQAWRPAHWSKQTRRAWPSARAAQSRQPASPATGAGSCAWAWAISGSAAAIRAVVKQRVMAVCAG